MDLINLINGSGQYKRERILGIKEPPEPTGQLSVIPDIKEIKAIVHEGEVYLNAKDVCLMMKKCSYKFNSISVCMFVKRFVYSLIG